MFRNFDEMLNYVKQSCQGIAIIAGAQIESALEVKKKKKKENLCNSILVGDQAEIN